VKLKITKLDAETAFSMRKYVLVMLIFVAATGYGQENIPVGSWRMPVSYRDAIDLAPGIDKTFASAKNGVFIFDREDSATGESICVGKLAIIQ